MDAWRTHATCACMGFYIPRQLKKITEDYLTQQITLVCDVFEVYILLSFLIQFLCADFKNVSHISVSGQVYSQFEFLNFIQILNIFIRA